MVLELTLWSMLALYSQKSTCLCLSSARIKGVQTLCIAISKLLPQNFVIKLLVAKIPNSFQSHLTVSKHLAFQLYLHSLQVAAQ